MIEDVSGIDRWIKAFAEKFLKEQLDSAVVFLVEQQVVEVVCLFIDGIDKKVGKDAVFGKFRKQMIR